MYTKIFLFLLLILFSGVTFAQTSTFENNYSVAALEKLQNTIPQNQKHAFYKQYFRAKIFEEMKSEFTYKQYSDKILMAFTDSVIAGNCYKKVSEHDSKIIKNLDDHFNKQLYNSQQTYQLLAKNAGLGENHVFPRVGSEAGIYEMLPGEILAYVTESGHAAGRHFMSYKISGNSIRQIKIIPSNKSSFQKVSKYAGNNWRFEERADYTIRKNKTEVYIISTGLYRKNDASCCSSMQIEYRTKDFKHFVALRIAENDEWEIIK